MATTVTIDSRVVDEVKAMTGARTKTEAVRRGVGTHRGRGAEAVILADTSCWIEYFHPKGAVRVKQTLSTVIESDRTGRLRAGCLRDSERRLSRRR